MKVVLYSESRNGRLKMYSDKWEHDKKYEIGSLANELRKEIRNKSEFGKVISKNLNQKNAFLAREHQKRLWTQILKRSIETEFLFLNLISSKEGFETLSEATKELGIEFKIILNLFLPLTKIEEDARMFFKIHDTSQGNSEDEEEEFVRKILSKEQQRLSRLEEIIGFAKIININSEGDDNRIVANIFKEIDMII